MLLFSATGVFAELQDSMNTIWGVKPKPNQGIWDFVRNRLLSLAMVFGIGFLLLVSMFVSTVLETVADFVAGDAKWLAFYARCGGLVCGGVAPVRGDLQVPAGREAARGGTCGWGR